MTYVAAFRTHRWDEDVAILAERFFAAFPASARKVVLADETRAPLDTPYEKVAHTSRSGDRLGLPAYPESDVLWHSGDYGLYFLLEALPDYDYYVMSEYDVAVNLSLEPMMADVSRRSIDVVLHDLKPSTPDWLWHEGGRAAFEQPWRCLMFFMVASNRAAKAMLRMRQDQAVLFVRGELAAWPNCETFIPSSLKALGMSIEMVDAFADTSVLRFRPRMSFRDPRTSAPGSIAHPVHGTKRFIPLLLRDRPWPGEYFEEGTELQIGFSHEAFEDYVEPLGRALLGKRDSEGLARLRAEMARRRLAPRQPPGDLALNKPALTSSTSQWSDSRDASLDARGANGDWTLDEHGFHSDEEAEPWWMVDLLEAHVIDRVELVNRPSFPDRFVKFRIESSLDASTWITRYVKIDATAVSCRLEAPWGHAFADPFVARHVRIVLLESRLFHLRRVRVFGRGIAAAAEVVSTAS